MVLDASAVLAWLFREFAWADVEARLAGSSMSTVNLAEVLTRIQRDGQPSTLLLDALRQAPIDFVAFTADDADFVASLEPLTRRHGISMGDRACLALALRRGMPVMTADRTWADLDLPLEIVLIR